MINRLGRLTRARPKSKISFGVIPPPGTFNLSEVVKLATSDGHMQRFYSAGRNIKFSGEVEKVNWGGKRAGSGRPKGSKNKKQSFETIIIEEAKEETLTPLQYMLKVMNDPAAPCDRRDKMAVAAAPYVHVKGEEPGKKKTAEERAKAASRGKFAPSKPPGLQLVK